MLDGRYVLPMLETPDIGRNDLVFRAQQIGGQRAKNSLFEDGVHVLRTLSRLADFEHQRPVRTRRSVTRGGGGSIGKT